VGITLAIAVLLLGWSFLVYYIYDSLKEIAELNEISKGSIDTVLQHRKSWRYLIIF